MRIWTVPVPEFLGGPFHDAGNSRSFDSGRELASESRPSAQDDSVDAQDDHVELVPPPLCPGPGTSTVERQFRFSDEERNLVRNRLMTGDNLRESHKSVYAGRRLPA